jgi:hypothetical protein
LSRWTRVAVLHIRAATRLVRIGSSNRDHHPTSEEGTAIAARSSPAQVAGMSMLEVDECSGDAQAQSSSDRQEARTAVRGAPGINAVRT